MNRRPGVRVALEPAGGEPGQSHYEVYHPRDYQPPPGSWASSDAIRRSMLKCRSRDTRPERAVRSAVHRLGLRYRVSRRPVPGVRRSADLVFSRARVAVFLDGCFWHGCPEHFVWPKTNADYWQAKITGNRARDRETDRILADAGWMPLRIWEHVAAVAGRPHCMAQAWSSPQPCPCTAPAGTRPHPLVSPGSGPQPPTRRRSRSRSPRLIHRPVASRT